MEATFEAQGFGVKRFVWFGIYVCVAGAQESLEETSTFTNITYPLGPRNTSSLRNSHFRQMEPHREFVVFLEIPMVISQELGCPNCNLYSKHFLETRTSRRVPIVTKWVPQ